MATETRRHFGSYLGLIMVVIGAIHGPILDLWAKGTWYLVLGFFMLDTFERRR